MLVLPQTLKKREGLQVMNRGELTREKILKTGLKMWLNDPSTVTANAIAKKIGMTHATIIYHFPHGVKDAVAEYAVERKEKKIISQLIVLEHDSVKGLSPTERMHYLSQL